MNENITPLPCPFCGTCAVVNHHQSQHYSAEGPFLLSRGYSIGCAACDCELRWDGSRDEYDDSDGDFNTDAEAIEAWNIRADNAYPALTARVKELEELSQALLDHVSLPRMQGLSDKGTRLTWLDELHGPRERLRAALNKEPT